MSGIDWSFVVGCWIGALAANVGALAYQVWHRRRERRRRKSERAAREAADYAESVAFLQDVSRKLRAEIEASRASRARMAPDTETVN